MAKGHDELLHRWFENVWNQGDVDHVDQLLAPAAVLHETAVGPDGTQTLEDFKAMARTLRQAIPDIRFRVDDTLQSGDRAAARVTVTGTHTGPGLGIAPTGRKFRVTGIVMIRVAGDRVVEGWSSFDMLGLFEQLGAVQRPAMGR